MATVTLLIIGSTAAVLLIVLLAWREVTVAGGQPVSFRARWLTFASVLVFAASLALRLIQLLSA